MMTSRSALLDRDTEITSNNCRSSWPIRTRSLSMPNHTVILVLLKNVFAHMRLLCSETKIGHVELLVKPTQVFVRESADATQETTRDQGNHG